MSDGHRSEPSQPAIRPYLVALESAMREPSGDHAGKLASPWSWVIWVVSDPWRVAVNSSQVIGALGPSVKRPLWENTTSVPWGFQSYSAPTIDGLTRSWGTP